MVLLPLIALAADNSMYGLLKGVASKSGFNVLPADVDPGVQLAVGVGLIIYAFLGLIGIVFMVLMIYGGFLWMTARGNEENVEKAQRIIKEVVIGILLILAAAGITQFVLVRLGGGQ